MKKLYLALISAFLLAGSLLTGNAYSEPDCTEAKLKLKNQTNQVLEKIKSLKKCAKPAFKYRLKACVQRKQEGSKGFNCSHELGKTSKSNGRDNCNIKFNKIKNQLKKLDDLITNEACLRQKL